jgi:hypothetical protein
MTKTILFMLINFFIQAELSIAADSKPLPQLDSFIQNIRQKLRSNYMVQSEYIYNEKVIERELDSDGKLNKTKTTIYEVYPSADEQFTYKKLISKDDKPVSAETIKKEDRDYDKKRQELNRRLDRETPDQKRRREEKEQEAKRKEEDAVDEAFRLFKITIIGREQMDGIPVITVSFEPRPDYAPKTDGGKILMKVRGKAWFSEEDYEYVRIEAELNDSLSYGLGFIVRLNKGAKMIFQRRKINHEVWLPVVSHFVGTGKILLFKGLHIDKETIYSDYHKISADTDFKHSAPKKP